MFVWIFRMRIGVFSFRNPCIYTSIYIYMYVYTYTYIYMYIYIYINIQHCNTLQHAATHNITTHHDHIMLHDCPAKKISTLLVVLFPAKIALQHTATHCNATHYNNTHYTCEKHMGTSRGDASRRKHCNTLQHKTTHTIPARNTWALLEALLPANIQHRIPLRRPPLLRLCSPAPDTHTHTRTHTHTHAQIYTHAHMHTHTYTQPHTRSYTHTHTHTHIHAATRTHARTPIHANTHARTQTDSSATYGSVCICICR